MAPPEAFFGGADLGQYRRITHRLVLSRAQRSRLKLSLEVSGFVYYCYVSVII